MRLGPGLRVCYSFYQFLGSIFWNHVKKSAFSLRNCNATHVWWFYGCRCVSKVKKHCWMYT